MKSSTKLWILIIVAIIVIGYLVYTRGLGGVSSDVLRDVPRNVITPPAFPN